MARPFVIVKPLREFAEQSAPDNQGETETTEAFLARMITETDCALRVRAWDHPYGGHEPKNGWLLHVEVAAEYPYKVLLDGQSPPVHCKQVKVVREGEEVDIPIVANHSLNTLSTRAITDIAWGIGTAIMGIGAVLIFTLPSISIMEAPWGSVASLVGFVLLLGAIACSVCIREKIGMVPTNWKKRHRILLQGTGRNLRILRKKGPLWIEHPEVHESEEKALKWIEAQRAVQETRKMDLKNKGREV